MIDLEYFREIWCLSVLTTRDRAERRAARHLTACELRTSKLLNTSHPATVKPISFDARTLVVTFDAASVLEALRSLGWCEPPHVIDLFAEYRAATNGQEDRTGQPTESPDLVTVAKRLYLPCGGLLAPEAFDAASADSMERHCRAAIDLMPHLLSQVSQPALALRRGAYAATVAVMQHRGIPLDRSLRDRACELHEELMDLARQEYAGVFFGGRCSAKRLRAWAGRQDYPWRRIRNSVDHFFDSYRQIDRIARLERIRNALRDLTYLRETEITRESRNHCDVRPFAANTGRNQPLRKQYAWEMPRALISPAPGTSLAIVDFAQQEIGIAAFLSDDPTMTRHYEIGDAFINFGKAAGLTDSGSTVARQTERSRIKQVLAPIMYGASAATIAGKLGCSTSFARGVIQTHKRIYHRFWEWRGGVIRLYNQNIPLETVYGWQRHQPITVPADVERLMRSAANFPVQAHGAEILWSACRRIHEAGFQLLGVLHDAVLVEAPAEDINDVCDGVSAIMRDASREILPRSLKTASQIAVHPNQFPFGSKFWAHVTAIFDERAGVCP